MRFAMQLPTETVEAICEAVGVEENPFVDISYVVVEPLSPTSFNITMMDEDAIFEAAKSDSELEILSM